MGGHLTLVLADPTGVARPTDIIQHLEVVNTC